MRNYNSGPYQGRRRTGGYQGAVTTSVVGSGKLPRMPPLHSNSPGLPECFEVRTDVLDQLGPLLRDRCAPDPIRQTVLITDANVGCLYADRVVSSLNAAGIQGSTFTVQPGEQSKSLPVLESLYGRLVSERFPRDGAIVALGGGVVSDLAGFAAGTWMRGVRWAICPTTLEADIDAAIGGKTAVNVPGGKNLVGVFHPPMLVAVDPACLSTLPRAEFVAGLAESIKHALIASEDFLRWHEENVERILALDGAVIVPLIERNIAIKSAIVARDPRETTGERMVLNFGHTIGHAIEECSMNRQLHLRHPQGVALHPGTADTAVAHSPHPGPLPGGGGEKLRHGECVAMGMVTACRLSQRLGLLDRGTVDRVEKLLLRFGLPTAIPPWVDVNQLLDIIRMDKKVRAGSVQFVLLAGVGKPVVRSDVAMETIEEALRAG